MDDVSVISTERFTLLAYDGNQFRSYLSSAIDFKLEIGYIIDPAFPSQGCTTETLPGMVEWAFSNFRCQSILDRETLHSNPASNCFLQKSGFRVYDENSQSISWCLDRRQREGNR